MNCLMISYDEYLNIPYLAGYEALLRECGVNYQIVLWDRRGLGAAAEREHAFLFHAKNPRSKLGKLLPFLRWRGFVLRLLRQRQYDRLIVLTTVPAVLLSDRLLGAYSGKYWMDIRDFTYENIRWYRGIVERLTRGAAGVSISSDGFRTFLDKGIPLYLSHNLTNESAEERLCHLDPRKRPIVIGFLGGLRYEKQNQSLMRQLAGSKKYSLCYMGKSHPGCDFPGFCRRNHIENVRFFPAYQNEDKPELYRAIDLINSIYGADTEVTRLALPNKLYDCALFKKPILVSEGTYLASVVREYQMGLSVDLGTESVEARLDEYLSAFDREAFENGCTRFLRRVRQERDLYLSALRKFLRGELTS